MTRNRLSVVKAIVGFGFATLPRPPDEAKPQDTTDRDRILEERERLILRQLPR